MREKLLIKEGICAVEYRLHSAKVFALFARDLQPDKWVIMQSRSISHADRFPTDSPDL